jgi:hypothetical protein
MDAEKMKDLADSVSQLQWWALATLLLGFVAWRFFHYLDKREERRLNASTEDAKAERARLYSESLSKLADAMNDHNRESTSKLAQVSDSVNKVTSETEKLTEKVDAISRKTKGVMSVDNTLTIIETYYSHVVNCAQRIVEQSLRENDYETRADYISRKIRTRIAEHITFARDQLHAINTLAVDPERFFITYVNSEDASFGERFQLCDLLWSAIEVCYTPRGTDGNQATIRRDLEDRIEEAKLLIENTMHDHYTNIANHLSREAAAGWREEGSGVYRRHRSGEFAPTTDFRAGLDTRSA